MSGRRGTLSPTAVVVMAIVLYVALFFFFGYRRHASFLEGETDLGIFDQSFWTATHGGMPFFNTFEGRSHFGVHWSPALLLLLPLYSLWPSANALIFGQTVLLALGAVPLYLVGRDLLGARAGSYLVIAYLLNFPLHGINYHEFHETGMVVAPLLLAIWGLLARRRVALWAGALLAMSVREDIGLVIACLAASGAWLQAETRGYTERPGGPDGRDWALLGALGFAWSLASLKWIIPAFGGSQGLDGRFSHLGGGPAEWVLSPLLRPGAFWGTVLKGSSVSYLLGLLAPVAFLPLYGLALLFPLATVLVMNLASSFGGMHLFTSHYAGPLVPFVFGATVLGVRRRVAGADDKEESALRMLRPAIVLSVLTMLAFDPSPLHIGRRPLAIDRHAQVLADTLASLPPDASISTQTNLWTHVTNRANSYVGYREGVEFIVVDQKGEVYQRYCALDKDVPRLVEEGKYVVQSQDDGVTVYRRRGGGSAP